MSLCYLSRRRQGRNTDPDEMAVGSDKVGERRFGDRYQLTAMVVCTVWRAAGRQDKLFAGAVLSLPIQHGFGIKAGPSRHASPLLRRSRKSMPPKLRTLLVGSWVRLWWVWNISLWDAKISPLRQVQMLLVRKVRWRCCCQECNVESGVRAGNGA